MLTVNQAFAYINRKELPMNPFASAVDTAKHLVQNINLVDAVMIECAYNEKFSQFMFTCVPYCAGQATDDNTFPKIRTTQTGTLIEYLLDNVKYENVGIDVPEDILKVFTPKLAEDGKCPRLFITFKDGEVNAVYSQNINSKFQFKNMLYGFKNMVNETVVNTIMVSNIQQLMFAMQSAAMGGLETKTKSGIIMPGK